MASAWMRASCRLLYRAKARVIAPDRAAGWMHRASCPGRSCGSICWFSSRMGRKASNPAMVTAYSSCQQASLRPQLAHRLSWAASMTQRNPSWRRGSPSHTWLTVSAREARLSAAVFSRAAATDRRGRAASSCSGWADCGSSHRRGRARYAPAPTARAPKNPKAVPGGPEAKMPVSAPPPYRAAQTSLSPWASSPRAEPQHRPTAAQARAASAQHSPAAADPARASRDCAPPRQASTRVTSTPAASPRFTGPRDRDPRAAAPVKASTICPGPGPAAGNRRTRYPSSTPSTASAPREQQAVPAYVHPQAVGAAQQQSGPRSRSRPERPGPQPPGHHRAAHGAQQADRPHPQPTGQQSQYRPRPAGRKTILGQAQRQSQAQRGTAAHTVPPSPLPARRPARTAAAPSGAVPPCPTMSAARRRPSLSCFFPCLRPLFLVLG